jgi:hypothetical protein
MIYVVDISPSVSGKTSLKRIERDSQCEGWGGGHCSSGMAYGLDLDTESLKTRSREPGVIQYYVLSVSPSMTILSMMYVEFKMFRIKYNIFVTT